MAQINAAPPASNTVDAFPATGISLGDVALLVSHWLISNRFSETYATFQREAHEFLCQIDPASNPKDLSLIITEYLALKAEQDQRTARVAAFSPQLNHLHSPPPAPPPAREDDRAQGAPHIRGVLQRSIDSLAAGDLPMRLAELINSMAAERMPQHPPSPETNTPPATPAGAPPADALRVPDEMLDQFLETLDEESARNLVPLALVSTLGPGSAAPTPKAESRSPAGSPLASGTAILAAATTGDGWRLLGSAQVSVSPPLTVTSLSATGNPGPGFNQTGKLKTRMVITQAGLVSRQPPQPISTMTFPYQPYRQQQQHQAMGGKRRVVKIIDFWPFQDVISREVVQPGRPAHKAIVKEFGRDVLLPNGEVDRKKLAGIIFHDADARSRLNRATHKWIQLTALFRAVGYFLQGKTLIVVDAPLLFETKIHKLCSTIIVVYADPATQLQRIIQRDNITAEEASARISAQMSIDQKCKLADHVITNTGTIGATQEQPTGITQFTIISFLPSTATPSIRLVPTQVDHLFTQLLAQIRPAAHLGLVGGAWLVLLGLGLLMLRLVVVLLRAAWRRHHPRR
ncbi:putative dephospho-CoA kinase [Paratrimastix pyriformis]|uniref:Dephospho-CoA kinase n=1 Tax=Paratrimastix pyriformis TaxID=342808 RepID=A0ABQ8UT23_9EUKA|nr:putative dephospho-CoA kinase [Paratrimastix pyriformis]